jgi:hypothetical protein
MALVSNQWMLLILWASCQLNIGADKRNCFPATYATRSKNHAAVSGSTAKVTPFAGKAHSEDRKPSRIPTLQK